jgi:hypothetical protein
VGTGAAVRTSSQSSAPTTGTERSSWPEGFLRDDTEAAQFGLLALGGDEDRGVGVALVAAVGGGARADGHDGVGPEAGADNRLNGAADDTDGGLGLFHAGLLALEDDIGEQGERAALDGLAGAGDLGECRGCLEQADAAGKVGAGVGVGLAAGEQAEEHAGTERGLGLAAVVIHSHGGVAFTEHQFALRGAGETEGHGFVEAQGGQRAGGLFLQAFAALRGVHGDLQPLLQGDRAEGAGAGDLLDQVDLAGEVVGAVGGMTQCSTPAARGRT